MKTLIIKTKPYLTTIIKDVHVINTRTDETEKLCEDDMIWACRGTLGKGGGVYTEDDVFFFDSDNMYRIPNEGFPFNRYFKLKDVSMGGHEEDIGIFNEKYEEIQIKHPTKVK